MSVSRLMPTYSAALVLNKFGRLPKVGKREGKEIFFVTHKKKKMKKNIIKSKDRI